MKHSGQTGTRSAAGLAPRILIVRVGAMGDVIHALPALAMLREVVPDAYIGWAIGPQWAPLLRAEGAAMRGTEEMPLVDAVHPVAAKQWNQHPVSMGTAQSILALRRDLRLSRYDVAVDLQGTLRSAVIARMSGAAEVVGSGSPRESLARHLYGTTVVTDAVHVADQASAIVSAALGRIGITAERHGRRTLPDEFSPVSMLPRDAAAEAWWRTKRSALRNGEPMVMLAATAGWGAKEWPAEKFAALAASLVEAGYRVLLNTGPGGADSVTARVLQGVHDRSPERAGGVVALPATLPQLIAATRDMTAVIAGDTGPLHLAEALGVPVVGLFGPTAPERTGPTRHAVNLRHPSSRTDHRRHTKVEAGLELLTIDEVFAAFERVTRTRAGGAR